MADSDTPLSHLSTERLFEIAGRLLEVETQNPPGETRVLADRVETFLDGLGLETRTVVTDPAKPNVIATLAGETDRTLLYNGHLDTVPFAEAEWTYDPLGERDGDRLYGRGATDMKGPLAAMLHAAEAFVETGTTPPVSLAFAIVSDEETGGSAGTATLLETEEFDALAPDACVIGETTCSDGRHSITVADRGSIWLTLRAEGEAAHGSRPVLGENAIDRLWGAIETVRTRLSARELAIPAAVRPIVDESVAYYAPTMGETAARELFEHPTVNLGTIEGGDSVNTVPSSARARLDIRLTAGIETRTVLADIRDCLAECPSVSIADASWSVGSYEPPDSPLVEAVATVARGVGDEEIDRRSATGGGDAKKFRHAGVPTVEFAFGTDTVHAVDEYTTAEALAGNAEVYTRLPAVWGDLGG
jgi:succinyl-diaminopimelate desuccinylase